MIFRELLESEFKNIPKEALGGYPLPEGGYRVFAGIDSDGKIAAIWFILMVVHLEPVWVREDYRKSPFVLRRLWGALEAGLRKSGIKKGIAVILDSVPITKKLALWMGAEEIPGKLFVVTVKD